MIAHHAGFFPELLDDTFLAVTIQGGGPVFVHRFTLLAQIVDKRLG